MASRLPPSAQPKPGEGKLQSVDRLFTILKAELTTPTLTAPQLTATLEQLKVYGRDPNGSDPIFTKDGIHTLCKYAFDTPTTDISTSREALRCIANALLLKEGTRKLFTDLGYDMKAAEKFKGTVPDDEFLLSRILFLTTHSSTTSNFPDLLSTGLPTYINTALTRHATSPSTAISQMALTETLKLLYNLGHHTQDPTLSICLPSLLTLLHTTPLATPPLQGTAPHLINALLCLDLTAHTETLFPPSTPTKTISHLIAILDSSTVSPDFDDAGIPLLTLFRKLLGLAPPPVIKFMKSTLLPAQTERSAPLGKSDTLPSRLLRLTTSLLASEHVSSLLFELSDSDPETYVANVGYGYASGLLMARGLQVGVGEGGESGEGGEEVNPITGQRVECESVVDPFEGMTEEEKEREAERLFVLFERLKKTGVIDVKNPVQQAVEEGRFEEIE